MTKLICPRCLKRELMPNMVFNSLSRRDNETYICNPCGTEEGLLDAGYMQYTSHVAERESRIKAPNLCVECRVELDDPCPDLCVDCDKPVCIECLHTPEEEDEKFNPDYCRSCYIENGYEDVVHVH